ncbi:MAG TPA: hypothetical protein VFP44_21405 [Usitatibacter sp.]|nr:hypothetical protein [Usitatibacter sp.]
MTPAPTPEPPFLVDGTHVVRYAIIDNSAPPPPHFNVVAAGIPIDLRVVSRLLVSEDLVKGGVYLMHCDSDWMTVAAEGFADADAAQRSAEARYAEVPMQWRPYRELSEAERREVETTREFLQELAAEFPNE